MIPKIIHYCWFGGKELPSDVKKCIKSWKKMCPDYEIKRWDESNFDISFHPFTKAAYEAKAWAFVSDYARLKIIFENGGIYLDTDVELIKNLDFLLDHQCYIGVQQLKHLCTTGLGFAAIEANPVVKKMLDQYDGLTFSIENKRRFACPYLNNNVLEEMGYTFKDEPVEIKDTLILPPRFLDPVAPGEGMQILKCSDTISIHHYSASWLGNKTVLKRRIIRMIGQERVNKIKRILRHE